VALDEFDRLQHRTEIIYDMRNLSRQADNEFGLLMVSNKHPTTIDLDPRSESRLTCQTLEFRPYTANRLSDILEQRVERAFHPEGVEEEVVEEVAEHVAEKSGDCRHALDLLLQAGRKADQKGADKVTVELLDEVM